MELMGLKVRDRVTGYAGVVESVSFDLYGCVQAVVRGFVDPTKPTDKPDGHWFDVKRLEVTDRTPVMAVPDFDKPEIGAADKPAR